jgi:hypothetical protein
MKRRMGEQFAAKVSRAAAISQLFFQSRGRVSSLLWVFVSTG